MVRTAHFPAVKTLEDFNLDHLPSLRRNVLAHLGTSAFVAKAENVILLGLPGMGKMLLAIASGVAAAMIDRLVHHAEFLTLAGDSCRTRSRRELLAR